MTRAFRTFESESADFSEVRVRKFRTLKTLRTRTQRVCLFKHLYGKVCPDKDGCLSELPMACDRPECKTRRNVDCTAWHTPLCKSFKRLSHCMNGDACTARHPATCTTKDCSYQSGCALWHTKSAHQDPESQRSMPTRETLPGGLKLAAATPPGPGAA
jgi:hypothetical protein